MKVYLANSSSQKTGGGWTFLSNLKKGLNEVTENYQESDIYFISGATMVSRDEVAQAKQDGKKIVLRVDNAVRNSRNRNTGMTRMKDFANWADLVIYQSAWAQQYLAPFLGIKGKVIVNGIDLNLFYPKSPRYDYYLYSRFNRDETKNWEVARYWFSRRYVQKPDSKLFLVGQFSQELIDGNFDFYMGERYSYLGELSQETMADLYHQCKYFIYPYFNDACSNSLIEALCSGCEIVGPPYYRQTGGAKQILTLWEWKGREYFSLERMCSEYKEALNVLV